MSTLLSGHRRIGPPPFCKSDQVKSHILEWFHFFDARWNGLYCSGDREHFLAFYMIESPDSTRKTVSQDRLKSVPMAEIARGFLFFLHPITPTLSLASVVWLENFSGLTHIMEITKPATILKHSSSTTLQQACSVLLLTIRLNLVSAAFITHANKCNLFENKLHFLAKRSNKTHEDAF